MKVGLIDVDSHNFPNLALMKISAFYKHKGEEVEFVRSGSHYEKVYISKIFTESKEPDINFEAQKIIRGGSGYDLKNKLSYEIEHQYPDYSLYPQFKFATGWLTRGCPRCNHKFCITPEKDGHKSIKVADVSEFWNGQKEIKILDQNILACTDRIELLNQLAETGVKVDFCGGLDVRYANKKTAEALSKIKVPIHHFAWDDPREKLEDKFSFIRPYLNVRNVNAVVYVLTNYWSTHQEDLHRIYTLKKLGFSPYVMIYEKQRYVDSHGNWLSDVTEKFTPEQIKHFKICQHMQRWTSNKTISQTVKTFDEYMEGRNMNLPKRIEY